MRVSKKNIPFLILLTVWVLFLIIALINQKIIKNNIDIHKYETIAWVYKVNESRTITSAYYYYYYYNGKKINSSETLDSNSSSLKEKYYLIFLSTENPNYSRIQLSKEIKDTVRIKAAGFKLR